MYYNLHHIVYEVNIYIRDIHINISAAITTNTYHYVSENNYEKNADKVIFNKKAVSLVNFALHA